MSFKIYQTEILADLFFSIDENMRVAGRITQHRPIKTYFMTIITHSLTAGRFPFGIRNFFLNVFCSLSY